MLLGRGGGHRELLRARLFPPGPRRPLAPGGLPRMLSSWGTWDIPAAVSAHSGQGTPSRRRPPSCCA